MTRSRLAAVLVFAIVTFGLTTSASAQGAADLYKSKTCVACHGADGKGETPMGKKMNARDFHSADVQKMTDQELFDSTKNGKNKMPAYKDKLSDAQIKELVQYVRELGKK